MFHIYFLSEQQLIASLGYHVYSVVLRTPLYHSVTTAPILPKLFVFTLRKDLLTWPTCEFQLLLQILKVLETDPRVRLFVCLIVQTWPDRDRQSTVTAVTAIASRRSTGHLKDIFFVFECFHF